MHPDKPPKILALDTSTRRGSAALLEGCTIAGELRIASLETHSARLLRSIDFLLSSMSWALTDIDCIAAGMGPGSFTGIRIGVSTALGLAQTLAIPFAGISGLDAVAHATHGVQGRLGVIMDAQRAQVYYAEYLIAERGIKRTIRPGLWLPEDLKHRLDHRRLHIVGDGVARYTAVFSKTSRHWPRIVDSDLFLAATIGRLAAKRKSGRTINEYLSAEPLYIRPPDAVKPRTLNRHGNKHLS